ncbi:hypothetical protein Tery_1678 [Trichodesmium erythraeum IMS101]|uniref:Uncharacterized protein n=1 Tax=Trichodesmium erythraeum (strain IMS101) TaxID=203124 RepID=Q114X5_TRIEI|nr:hypothetical protein [Trichodesmium erythraeum GBRTRLIN201]MCH2049209.1 hypothetical protein [Trichodesmium sp. ALOHA_ZT_67]
MKNLKLIQVIKTGLSLASINLILAFIGLEAVSLGFYYYQEKQLFYTRKNTISQVREELKKTGTRLGENINNESILERLHPFFGYVLKQGSFANEELGIRVNNYGLVSMYDYPFVKSNKNQFIIGVFGGSVANDFAVNSISNGSIGDQGFIQNLKQIPQLKEKEIIILCFASGGYKQPQQLLMLNYFISIGQEFDLVINIDGFNEVALSHQNNQKRIDLSLPSIQHILPLTQLASDDLSVMAAIVQISELKNNLSTGINKLESCKLALCYGWRSLQVKGLFDRYKTEIIKYDKKIAKNSSKIDGSNSLVYLKKMPAVLEEKVAFEKVAENWYESSLTMSQILADRNILYLHFIQPNQYYPTEKVYSPEEKIFIIEDHSYAVGVRKGYPVLLSKINSLQEAKVNIFNTVNIFDEEKEIVYRDACCHYNMVGQTILERYVANSIKTIMEKKEVN